MSLNRAIAHNTIIQLGGKVVNTLLGLVAVALMTRSLGAEQFGWYITASGFLQFVGIFCDFGFALATAYLLAQPQWQEKDVMDTLFTWRFISAIVFHGLAPLIFFLLPYPPSIKYATAILSLSFLGAAMSQVFIGYYRAKLNLLAVTVAEFISRVALVAGIFFVASHPNAFIAMMLVVTGASLLNVLYLWYSYGPIHWQTNHAISRAAFLVMWPTALSIIFNSVYWLGDRLLLPLYVDQAQVGMYGAAYRVLDIAIQVAAIVMGILMPLVAYAWARGQREDFEKRFQMSLDILALFLFPIVAGAWVLSEPIMNLVAGAGFAGSGVILRWLCWSILGTCLGMTFGHIALSVNRQKEALWVYISDAILSLLGYLIFIPKFGVLGAAGVTIFSEFYAGAGLALVSIGYSGYYPKMKTVFKITIASIIMAAVVWQKRFLPLPASIVVGGIVYAALLVILKVTSPAFIKEMLSLKQIAQKS